MRTLQLTHEQIALIKEALGIAENEYSNVFKRLCELNAVRYNENSAENKSLALNYHDKAALFADVCIDLEQGKFDI